jgi:hypothetical protein
VCWNLIIVTEAVVDQEQDVPFGGTKSVDCWLRAVFGLEVSRDHVDQGFSFISSQLALR